MAVAKRRKDPAKLGRLGLTAVVGRGLWIESTYEFVKVLTELYVAQGLR